MLAAYYERQGSPDVLEIGKVDEVMPKAGEVRVRIHASGLNPSDIKGRTGFNNVPLSYPRVIPHQDGAGIIDQIGDGVSPERLGERVWLFETQSGRPYGTAAEYAVVPTGNAVLLPDNVSFQVGACLGIAAMTAHRCLFADGDLAGKWVLVQGGAGAVGNAAILLAKWAGASVITTVSRPEQEEVVRAAGADVIINRRSDDVAARVLEVTDGKGVTRIVDVNLVENIETDMKCLALNGVISAYATEEPTAVVAFPFLKTMFRGSVVRMVFVYSMGDEAHQAAIAHINMCLAVGQYVPHIGLVTSLANIAKAHQAQEDGTVIGKIVVDLTVT